MNQKRVTRYIRVLLLMLPSLTLLQGAGAQCDPTVPTFYVDLTGNPDSAWQSPDTIRNDHCCGATNPDRCIRFIVTLDSNAIGINFNIVSGALPPGALFYQIGCGASYAVGDDICLNGVGPHELTFCKPGNNQNVYGITSIPEPGVSDPITVSAVCSDTLYVTGLVKDSIVWRSVPNNPTYDSYLSQTSGDDTVTVTPSGAYPSIVDYEVCGPVVGSCRSTYFCDTVRVTFVSDLVVTILPEDPAFCFGGSPVEIFAVGSGGVAPYAYLWSTGQTSDTITVGSQGTYSVQITDSMGCHSSIDSVEVDSFSVDITANAGNDTFMCGNESAIAINGSVTGVTSGIWLGADGIFSPSADSLNIMYFPDSIDRANGQITLYLYTTNNKTCPGDTDDVIIQILDNPVPLINGPDTACQFETAYLFTSTLGTEIPTWSAPNGTISSSANANPVQIIWNDTGYQTVMLQVMDTVSGCDSVIYDSVYVAPKPEPEIIGDDSACLNKIYVYSTSGQTGHSYQWSVLGGILYGDPSSTSIEVLWTSLTGGSVSLTQTSPEGCETTVILPVTVVYTPAPAIILPNDTACENKIYNYSITPAAGESFMWAVSGGTIIGKSDGNNIDVLWGGPGTGTVTVTQISPFGCDSTVSENVTIVQTPKPVIIIPNDSACEFRIASYAVNQIPGETYFWQVSGGTILGSSSSHIVNVYWGANGLGSISVTQTSVYGCDSTVKQSIVIKPTPAPVITGPDELCMDATESYSTANGPGLSYQWDVMGGNIVGPDNQNTVAIRWNTLGYGEVRLTVVNAYGCDSSTTKPVNVNPNPYAIIGGSYLACANSISNPYYLKEYGVQSSSGSLLYEWSVIGGNIVNGSQKDKVIIHWGDTGTYPVMLKLTNSLSGCMAYDSFYVNVGIIREPVIEPGDYAACVPFNLTLNEQSKKDSVDYFWQVMGFSGMQSKEASPTFTFTKPSMYQLRLIVKNKYGCKDTAYTTIDATLFVTANFTILSEESLFPGDNVTFINHSIGASNYEWDFHDGTFAYSVHADKIYNQPGEYPVTLLAWNDEGCRDSVTKHVKIQAIPEIYIPNAFTPNWDEHNTYFTIYTSYIIRLEFIIFNRWGEIIYQGDNLDVKWDGVYKGVPVPEGVYGYYCRAVDYNGKLIVKKGNITVLR